MAKIQWKGGTLLSPLPAVLVTCGEGENANVLTVAWTGILSSDPPRMYISVRKERHSHGIIANTREFCVNLTTQKLARAADLCGVKSGRDCDKFALAGITKADSFAVKCPSVAESPLTLECRVLDVIESGSHDIFTADIVAVSCEESLIDANGRLMLEKAGLIAYAHGEYFTLGERLGGFGFSVRKKAKK